MSYGKTSTVARTSISTTFDRKGSIGSLMSQTLEEEFFFGNKNAPRQALDRILEDDSLRNQFRVFLSTRRAEENLAFLGAIKSLNPGNVRQVYLWYLFDDSPFEINLTAQTAEDLIAAYMKVRGIATSSEWYKVFANARNEIHDILGNMANEFLLWSRNYYIFWKNITDKKKKVLVIGSGPCGIMAAKMLENIEAFKVTMVTKINFSEFKPALIHITHPSRMSKYHVPVVDSLTNTDIILGEVNAVEQNRAYVGQNHIDFDYCILACGKSYRTGPSWGNNGVTKEYNERIKEATANEIRRANSVLVIGGGPVGVSSASEIKSSYPNKNVVLLENSSTLLKNEEWGPHGMGKMAQRYLENLGVTVYTNKLVSATISDNENSGYYYVHTADGLCFHVDLVVSARPPVVNSFILKKKDVATFTDSRGYLLVPKTMNIPGTTHIYAGGVVCKSADEYDPTVLNSMITGCIIARNICRDFKGKELSYHGHKGFPEYIKKDNDPLASVMVGDVAFGRQGLSNLSKRTPDRYNNYGLPSPPADAPREPTDIQDLALNEGYRQMHVDAYNFWHNVLVKNERPSWLGEEPKKITIEDYKKR